MRFRSEKRIKQASHKQNCERFDECPFITKFEKSEECSIKDYKQMFCSGHLLEECERLRFFRENGVEAPEDMAPTGIYLNRARNFTRKPKHEARNTRIMIFGGKENTGSLYSIFLRSKGYEVLHFPDPAACALVARQTCACPRDHVCADMFLAEMDMEGITGLELIQRQSERGCRAIPQNKAVLSARLKYGQEQEIRALGSTSFKKPLRLMDLLAWVSECEQNIPPNRQLTPYEELLNPGSAVAAAAPGESLHGQSSSQIPQ